MPPPLLRNGVFRSTYLPNGYNFFIVALVERESVCVVVVLRPAGGYVHRRVASLDRQVVGKSRQGARGIVGQLGRPRQTGVVVVVVHRAKVVLAQSLIGTIVEPIIPD